MNSAFDEIVDFIAHGTTPQSVIDFHPSEAARSRVWDLIERKKSDLLSAEESAELQNFMQLEHLMRLAKAKAREFVTTG